MTDFAEEPQPPCPVCGTPLDVEWVEASVWGSTTPRRTRRLECPQDRQHDVTAAYQQLDTPTDDDSPSRPRLRLVKEQP